MAEQEEKTKQETVTLPQSIVEFVQLMADHGIIAKRKAAILRHLIVEGVQQVIRDDLVGKTLMARKQLSTAQKAKKKS